MRGRKRKARGRRKISTDNTDVNKCDDPGDTVVRDIINSIIDSAVDNKGFYTVESTTDKAVDLNEKSEEVCEKENKPEEFKSSDVDIKEIHEKRPRRKVTRKCNDLKLYKKIPLVLIPKVEVTDVHIESEPEVIVLSSKNVVKRIRTSKNKITKEAHEEKPRGRPKGKTTKDNSQPKVARRRKKNVQEEVQNNSGVEPNIDLTQKEICVLLTQKETNYHKELYFSYSELYSCLNQETNQSDMTTSLSQSSNFEQTENQKFQSLPVLPDLDDKSLLKDFNETNLKRFSPVPDLISDDELKTKLKERLRERKKQNLENQFTEETISLSENDAFEPNAFKDTEKESDYEDGYDNLKGSCKLSMQDIIEAFMNKSEIKSSSDITFLKRGLCPNWLSRNYVCSNPQCPYSHSAVQVFITKLKRSSSKDIMTSVVSMRFDDLFVDVTMASFKIFTERREPLVWITFLIFFIFYVTEPSDCRFLKFWANAARFFCQLNKDYAAAKGFASLLSIFSQGSEGDQWKIMEFIKIIKKPPIQISVTYALLQPILKMNVPLEFMIEAVISSTQTGKDVFQIYNTIIPKISLMSSPVHVIESLLEFCKTLEVIDEKNCADNLRLRLKAKVRTFKIKIIGQEYPLTASFQEEVSRNSDGDSPEPIEHFEAVNWKGNYLEFDQDFYQRLMGVLEITFESLPDCKLKENGVVPFENKNHNKEKKVTETQVTRIRQFFNNSQFDLLGKYLNELKSDVIQESAEMIVKLLLKMTISPDLVVDLIKIFILSCKSESSSAVIASVCITLIFNLVRINKWNEAYTLVKLCQEKQINLVHGKVFYGDESSVLTQCRIVLLLVEIWAHKENYQNAIQLVKMYGLTSPTSSVFKLTWIDSDEIVRVKILEELLWQMVFNQLNDAVFDFFTSIWTSQGELNGPIGLRKFGNAVLTLLLNKDVEEALTFYEKIKIEVELNNTNLRAILVMLVRQNNLSAAKKLIFSPNQNVYVFPELNSTFLKIRVCSSWLEEEFYVLFDVLFDLLSARKFDNFDVYLSILTSETLPSRQLRPLCLDFINTSFDQVCTRINRVLKYQFNPPLKLNVSGWNVKLDEHSLQLHLYKRICRDLDNN